MKNYSRLVMFFSLSVVIGILEILILPTSILPFIKVGLANIVTLVVLYTYNYKSAAVVTLMRVIIVSLITGTLFSPVFTISMIGAIFALIFLYFAHKINIFSVVGVSVFSSFGHIIGQVMALYLITDTVFVIGIIPILGYIALISGIIVGLVSLKVITRLSGVLNEKM